MRIIPPDLQAHLDSGATTLCWCWRVIRTDSLQLGFTDHDRDVSFDGTLFEAATGFTTSEARQTVGLNVDNVDIGGVVRSDRIEDADLAAGLYDDAQIEVFRVNWSAVEQRVLLRVGTLGEVTRGDHLFRAEIRGLSHYLGQQQGRIFQRTCDADLGDERCGVDLGTSVHTATGAALSALTPSEIAVSGLDTFDADWFAHGSLAWTSGANAGHSSQIKSHKVRGAQVSLVLWRPAVNEIGSGDAFIVVAGCNKHLTTCQSKFANVINFRGFPHIPGNDFVMSYPNSDDRR